MTLIVASRKLGYSTAVLSRLERGLRSPNRSELLLMIRGYGLSHWEAHALLISAGFLPELPPFSTLEIERSQLMQVLEQITLPAFIMEASGYLIAWNSVLQTLWNLRDDYAVHMLDQIFSAAVQKSLGDSWRPRAINAVWVFYLRTLCAPNQKAYARVIDNLAAKHGTQFYAVWTEALARGHDTGSKSLEQAGIVTPEYDTAAGRITYMVARVGIQVTSHLALYMLLPLGKENGIRQIHLQSMQERVRTITPHNPALPFTAV